MTIEAEAPPTSRNAGRLRPRTSKPDAVSPTSTPAPPRISGRRNPKWIALGVLALCLGALLSYFTYSRVAHESTVVSVVHMVPRGSTVRASDLAAVTIGAQTGVRLVPATELPRLIGHKAVYDLVAGSYLPIGAVADVVVPATGRAMVGVKLVAGRVPAGELPPGTPVRLIAIPPAGASPKFSDAYSGSTVSARVVSLVAGADGTSTVVNVDVVASQAPTVALLSSQERLALVRDADR